MEQKRMPLWTETKAILRIYPFNRDFGEGKKAEFSPEERLEKARTLFLFAKSLTEPNRSRVLSWMDLDGWMFDLTDDAENKRLPEAISMRVLELQSELTQLIEIAPYRLR